MRIEELAPEQSITFLVITGGKQLEFPSTVLESLPRKHMILAMPIMKGDKIISLSSNSLIVHLIATFPEQKPMVFQNVTVQSVKREDDSLCYAITCAEESKELNRRGAFRCFLGIESHIRVGNNKAAIPVTLKDISVTGFSFTISSTREYAEKDKVHAVLNDYIEESGNRYSFQLYGTIVRHVPLENGMTVYGCQLNGKVVGLDRYIMEKERMRLRKSHGKSSTPPKNNK